jgi:hypothetical protein
MRRRKRWHKAEKMYNLEKRAAHDADGGMTRDAEMLDSSCIVVA